MAFIWVYNKVKDKDSEFECGNRSHFLVQLEHGNGLEQEMFLIFSSQDLRKELERDPV